MFVNFYVWVKGEGFEDSICLKSGLSDQSSRSFGIVSGVGPARGVSEFLNRLDVLPGFSLKDLETALKTLFDDDIVVWRRFKPPPKREITPAANRDHLTPDEVLARVRSSFANVRVEGPEPVANKGMKLFRDAVIVHVDDEAGRPLLYVESVRDRNVQVDVGDVHSAWPGYTKSDQTSAELSFWRLVDLLGYEVSTRTNAADSAV